MRRQLLSNRRDAQRSSSRGIASTLLSISLTAGIVPLSSAAAFGQTTFGQPASPDMLPPAGMGMTTPLATGSTRPAGIPLGSTEIATPGVSPVFPSQSTGTVTCGGSGGTSSSTPLFDGGVSGNTTLSCADSQNIPSSLPAASTAGRTGIPLGATELGNAGISPSAPVTSPNMSSGTNPVGSSSTATNPGNP